MHNVDFYDARVLEATSTSITLDNGKVEDISVNHTRGVGVRALCGGSWGFTSADGDFDLQKAIRSASELAIGMNTKTPKEKVELVPVSSPVLDDVPVARIDPADISIEEKVDLLKEIGERAKVDGVNSTTAIYSESALKISYMSSEGIECEYELVRSGFVASAVASRNGLYQVGSSLRLEAVSCRRSGRFACQTDCVGGHYGGRAFPS